MIGKKLGLVGTILATLNCASTPEVRKQPIVIYLDLVSALPHFESEHGGCVGIARGPTHGYESSFLDFIENSVGDLWVLGNKAREEYKRICSPNIEEDLGVYAGDGFAIAYDSRVQCSERHDID